MQISSGKTNKDVIPATLHTSSQSRCWVFGCGQKFSHMSQGTFH